MNHLTPRSLFRFARLRSGLALVNRRARQTVRTSHLATVLAALLTGASLRAEAVLIVNPGFESPAPAAGDFNVNAPGPLGWSAYGAINHSNRSIGVLHPAGTTLYASGVPEGNNVGVVFLWDDFGDQSAPAFSPAGLEQTLSASLTTDTRYVLDYMVGNIAEDRTDTRHDDFTFAGFPGYRVELLAGGQAIAVDHNTLLPAEGGFLAGQITLSIGATHALAGQNLGIRLINLNAGPGLEVNFDAIQLDATAIPEPAAMAASMGVFGLVATLLRRRPKRRDRRSVIG